VSDITSLISKVRLELGDLGKSFVTQFESDGTTNRFKLHYSPVDADSVIVYADGTDVSEYSFIEDSTGVMVVTLTHEDFPDLVDVDTDVPKLGVKFSVSGQYFRYFTKAELTTLVNTAVSQHSANHTDAMGRKIIVSTLPAVEEYAVAVYATTLALYTLATDSAFDIDIYAPDGVNIPRSERYRQLMQMIGMREAQYRDLCVQLGIGMYKIDVFSLRRISKTTNRYVPLYKPQEVDDRSFPQRVHLSLPTYGDNPVPWEVEGPELLAYQGRAWSNTITFNGDYTGQTLVARIILQRGSWQEVMRFAVTWDSTGTGSSTVNTAAVSLTADETFRLSNRTYWQIASYDENGSGVDEYTEILGGNFFTERASEVIL
jgi:hypothetical protein